MVLSVLWRAPAVFVDSMGMIYMPDLRFDFANAFTWGAMAVFSFYVAAKINLWWGLFLVLATVSAFYPVNSGYSERTHHMIFYGVVWYMVCVKATKTEQFQRWALNGICIVGLAHIMMIFSQGFFQYDPLLVGIAPKWGSIKFDPVPNVGLMSCANDASALLVVTLAAFLRWGDKWRADISRRGQLTLVRFDTPRLFRPRWGCFLPLFIPAFILTHTFTGPLGALAVIACWISSVHKLNILKTAAIFLVCIGVLFAYFHFVDRPDPGWRYKTWKSALTGSPTGVQFRPTDTPGKFEARVVEAPWWWVFHGIGIGHWKLNYARKDVSKHTLNQYFAQAHNEFVQGQTEIGIGFSVIVIGFFVNILLRLRKEAHLYACALIGIIITCTTFFTFHIPTLAMVCILWLALLESTLKPDSCFASLSSWLICACSRVKREFHLMRLTGRLRKLRTAT